MKRILSGQAARLARMLALGATFFALGCSGPQLAKYDETSYRNLTYLKPEVVALYEGFKKDPIDEKVVEATQLKVAQAREYEVGKGLPNADMTAQVDTLQKMFKRHVEGRRRDGPWNDVAFQNYRDDITTAFDLTIRTEQAKNR